MKIINSQKHIAFFIPSLGGGGAERMFLNLANEFVRRGLRVDLVLVRKEGPYLNKVAEEVNIVDLGARRTLFSLVPLIKYLRRERPRALIASMEHANIIAILAKFLARVKTKVIIRIANTLSVSLQGSKGYRQPLRLYGTILFSRFADKIIAVSKGVADDFAKTVRIPRETIKVIYNPTVTKKMLYQRKKHRVQNTDKAQGREQKKQTCTVLGIGRLHPQKDFGTLIRAFAKVRENRNAKLIILGEGEKRKELKELVKELDLREDVELPGFVDNPYVYMARADVFVLSSRWEGLPNTLIEAMACGTPVVSTNCPSGPAEILENGKYGKLVPVEDVDVLAKAILETLENPIDSRKLQERAEYFSVKKAAEKYLAIMSL